MQILIKVNIPRQDFRNFINDITKYIKVIIEILKKHWLLILLIGLQGIYIYIYFDVLEDFFCKKAKAMNEYKSLEEYYADRRRQEILQKREKRGGYRSMWFTNDIIRPEKKITRVDIIKMKFLSDAYYEIFERYLRIYDMSKCLKYGITEYNMKRFCTKIEFLIRRHKLTYAGLAKFYFLIKMPIILKLEYAGFKLIHDIIKFAELNASLYGEEYLKSSYTIPALRHLYKMIIEFDPYLIKRTSEFKPFEERLIKILDKKDINYKFFKKVQKLREFIEKNSL